VYGNFVDHTMRGIDIDGGTQAVIDGTRARYVEAYELITGRSFNPEGRA